MQTLTKSDYTMVFTENDKGNYLSKGKKGSTVVARTEKGWIHCHVTEGQKSVKSEGRQPHTSHIDALKAAAEEAGNNGFVVHYENRRKNFFSIPYNEKPKEERIKRLKVLAGMNINDEV